MIDENAQQLVGIWRNATQTKSLSQLKILEVKLVTHNRQLERYLSSNPGWTDGRAERNVLGFCLRFTATEETAM